MAGIKIGSVGTVYFPGSTFSLSAAFTATANLGPIAFSAQIIRVDNSQTIATLTLQPPTPSLANGKSITKIFNFVLPPTIQPGNHSVTLLVNTADSTWKELAKKANAITISVKEGEPLPPPIDPPITPPVEPPIEPPPTGGPPMDGLTLAWTEEWNDLSKWADCEPWFGPPGYQDGPTCWGPVPAGEHATVADHKLQLRLTKPGGNGNVINIVNLDSRKSFPNFVHGYIEARWKLTSCAQAWPAFWLMGNGLGTEGWPKCGEIDIFEFVNNGGAWDTARPYFTVHWSGPPSGGNQGHYMHGVRPPPLPSYATDFHSYGLWRTANELIVYIDGIEWAKITAADLQAIGGNWQVIFNEPMHIRLTLSSGGDDEGPPPDWAYDPRNPAAVGEILIEPLKVWAAP